jgi:Cation transporter/ATPase, N-terminus
MPTSDLTGPSRSTIAEILAKLGTDPKRGLNPEQVQELLDKYGPNALAEEKKSALSAFLPYFWGPIPWMIELFKASSALDASCSSQNPNKALNNKRADPVGCCRENRCCSSARLHDNHLGRPQASGSRASLVLAASWAKLVR